MTASNVFDAKLIHLYSPPLGPLPTSVTLSWLGPDNRAGIFEVRGLSATQASEVETQIRWTLGGLPDVVRVRTCDVTDNPLVAVSIGSTSDKDRWLDIEVLEAFADAGWSSGDVHLSQLQKVLDPDILIWFLDPNSSSYRYRSGASPKPHPSAALAVQDLSSVYDEFCRLTSRCYVRASFRVLALAMLIHEGDFDAATSAITSRIHEPRFDPRFDSLLPITPERAHRALMWIRGCASPYTPPDFLRFEIRKQALAGVPLLRRQWDVLEQLVAYLKDDPVLTRWDRVSDTDGETVLDFVPAPRPLTEILHNAGMEFSEGLRFLSGLLIDKHSGPGGASTDALVPSILVYMGATKALSLLEPVLDNSWIDSEAWVDPESPRDGAQGSEVSR